MLQSYIEELKKTELLEPETERELWRRAAEGDSDAHTELMTAYQPLVFKVAMSFKLSDSQTMELIQEGMVGLLEAAERYDYTRGVAFSLFASYRIKGAMLNFLKEQSSYGLMSLDTELSTGHMLKDILVCEEAGPAELMERQLLEERVSQAVQRLPEKEQQVLQGLYVDEISPQSMAEAIDVSLGHVYRLQKQGVRRVRGMLSRFMHELKD